VDLVDVLLGNEEDFSAGLGYELDGINSELLELDPDAYGRMLGQVLERSSSSLAGRRNLGLL
jgi:2-dehydro-3-deoxygluconokinase